MYFISTSFYGHLFHFFTVELSFSLVNIMHKNMFVDIRVCACASVACVVLNSLVSWVALMSNITWFEHMIIMQIFIGDGMYCVFEKKMSYLVLSVTHLKIDVRLPCFVLMRKSLCKNTLHCRQQFVLIIFDEKISPILRLFAVSKCNTSNCYICLFSFVNYCILTVFGYLILWRCVK